MVGTYRMHFAEDFDNDARTSGACYGVLYRRYGVLPLLRVLPDNATT